MRIKLIGTILIVFLFFNLSQNKIQMKKSVVLYGDLELKKDFWGRRVFKGKVKNNSSNRLDFIRIDFKIYNVRGELITEEGAFIDGIRFMFGDTTVSQSSLKPGGIGSFKVYTSVPADSIDKFTYEISYKYFKYR